LSGTSSAAWSRASWRRRLALIDPIGFWRNTYPIVNWVKLSPAELPNYIFRNPAVGSSPQASRAVLGRDEPGAAG